MAKKVERYTCKCTFDLTDKDLREAYPENITVFYGIDTYNHSVEHIMKLTNTVREDFPSVSEEEMEVLFVARERSDRHAGHTVLQITVDIDDFIRLRNKVEIGVL